MGKQNKPNLFIAGVLKCGTTSMHDYLDQHPEIFMSEPKEPRYFCKDFHEEAEINNSKQYFPALTWSEYKECFDGAKEYDVIGEASPIYLYSDVAMRKIKVPLRKLWVFRIGVSLLHHLIKPRLRGFKSVKSTVRPAPIDQR